MKKLFKTIWPYLKNKYVLTIGAFIVWILFFSQYNLLDRIHMAKSLRQLKDEKQYYKEQIKRDSTRLYELTTNDENLEKFAREQYYMKKKNEDLFVIIEE
ncbi:MAG: septum formation initiator family protein [Bacteroidales bacterium]|nr:septum formation initiator family protein [Bacteroidales bacterium]